MSGCVDCNELNQGPAGYNGWNPVLTQVEDNVNLDDDGQPRIVLQLDGWIGGTGITPTNNVGDYLSTSGFTTTIASATNIRGSKGTDGSEGNGYKLTSITNLSLPISLGSQLIVVDKTAANSAYTIGARVRVASRSNPTIHFFEGVLTNYTGTNFTINIDYSTQPSPVVTNIIDWDVNITGENLLSSGLNDDPWITYTPVYGTDTVMLLNSGINEFTNFQVSSGKIKYKKLGKTIFYHFNFTLSFGVNNGGVSRNFDYRLALRLPVFSGVRYKLMDRNNNGNTAAYFVFASPNITNATPVDFTYINITATPPITAPITAPTLDEWFQTTNFSGSYDAVSSTLNTENVTFIGNFIMEVL